MQNFRTPDHFFFLNLRPNSSFFLFSNVLANIFHISASQNHKNHVWGFFIGKSENNSSKHTPPLQNSKNCEISPPAEVREFQKPLVLQFSRRSPICIPPHVHSPEGHRFRHRTPKGTFGVICAVSLNLSPMVPKRVVAHPAKQLAQPPLGPHRSLPSPQPKATLSPSRPRLLSLNLGFTASFLMGVAFASHTCCGN